MAVVDIYESPAVPPTDPGGDERIGLQIAGALLIVVGFGVGAFLNLGLHILAGSGSLTVGPWTFTATLGSYAWAILLLGFGTGLVGIALLWVARSARKGPFVLPGYPY